MTAPPERIPPSIGGSGLALIAGGMLATRIVEAVRGEVVPLGGWLLPLGMGVFVVALLQLSLYARRRFGVVVDPSSIRRQWLAVALATLLGVVTGAALSLAAA